MALSLPDTLTSREEVIGVVREVHQFAAWVQQVGIAKKAGASLDLPEPQLSAITRALLIDYKKQHGLASKDLDVLTSELERLHKTATTLTVTLAAPATSEVKAELIRWVRTNLGQNILITFQFNSTILGGLIVRCGSHVYDWSFRSRILNERHKFAEVLSRV